MQQKRRNLHGAVDFTAQGKRWRLIQNISYKTRKIRLTRFGAECTIETRGNDSVVGFNRIQQGANHLNNGILSPRWTWNFGLISKIKSGSIKNIYYRNSFLFEFSLMIKLPDGLNADTVASPLRSGRCAKRYLQDQLEWIQLPSQSYSECMRPIPAESTHKY